MSFLTCCITYENKNFLRDLQVLNWLILFSRLFKDVPRVMVPILWFTQSAELTPSLADMVKFLLKLPTIGLTTFFGLAGIGALLIVCGLLITVRKAWEVEEDDKLSVIPIARGTDEE
jgi:hypothetical protein